MNDILQYKGYYASLHFSADDEVFFGKLLGIDDLVNFEGASVRELKKAFHEAVDDYLETCEQLGKEPNKTYKGSFNVRISTELHKAAAVFASVHNISLNDFVRTAIDYALQNKDAVNKRIRAQV
jgi:predicted HicB family RNase H-like nuclease